MVTIAAGISGGNSLTKDGAGILVLCGTNKYTGGTTLLNGTLGIGDDSALGTGTFTINNNTTNFAWGGPRTVTNAIAFSGNGAYIVFGGIEDLTYSCIKGAPFGADRQIFVTNGSVTVTIAAGLNGNNIIKYGLGTLGLSGTNFFSVSMQIKEGTVDFIGPDGVLRGCTNITVEPTGKLNLNNTANVLADNAIVTLKSGSGYGRMFLVTGAEEVVYQLYYDGVPQPAGTYGSTSSTAGYQDNDHFEGTGILRVLGVTDTAWATNSDGNWSDSTNWLYSVVATGSTKTAYFTNSLTATRTVNQDFTTLDIGGLWFGSPSSDNWILNNNIIVLTNSIITVPKITVSANTATIGSAISGAQGFTKEGQGTLVLNSANNYSGATLVNGGTLRLGVADAIPDAGSITVNSTLDLNGFGRTFSSFGGTGVVDCTSAGTSMLTISNNAANTFSGSLRNSSGTLSLIKDGTGFLTLSGISSFGGSTVVTGGCMIVQTNMALGNSSGVTVGPNASLRLNNGITISGIPAAISGSGIDVYGAMVASNGVNTWDGNITLQQDQARIGASPNATLVVNGVIDSGTSAYGLAIRSANAGDTVLLNGINTYSGGTYAVVGTLKLGGNDRLPTKQNLVIGNNSNNGGARVDLNGFDQKVSGLISAGTTMEMNITNSYPDACTFTVSNVTVNVYTGRINGAVNLVKAGQGMLRLCTNNVYTGTTRIIGAGSTSTSVVDVIPGGSITSSVTIIIETNAQFVIETATNVIGDSAQVMLNSAGANYGMIYLTNGVNEVVGGLYFNGTPQRAGTWGATGSGCLYTNNSYFRGGGRLTVTGAGSGSWNVDNSGDWSNTNNWLNYVIATGQWSTAYFTYNITQSRTINQDANPMNIGSLYIGSPSAYDWCFTNGTINLTNSATPFITVTANSATFSNTINSAQGLVKDGNGTMVISGVATCGVSATVRSGNMTISNDGSLRGYPNSFSMYVGDAPGYTGILNVIDGTLAVSNTLVIGGADNGCGIANIAGNSATVTVAAVTIGRNAGSSGTLNLSAGTVFVNTVTMVGGSTSTNASSVLNVSGGTLNVGTGGIANTKFDILSGVSREVLLSGGTLGGWTNHWSCPTDIVLTNNPGPGTVTFRAADINSVAKSIVLHGGISGIGNLTKTGTGTLYLFGGTNVNYSGQTAINEGTLVIDGINLTNAVSIAGGAALILPSGINGRNAGGLRGEYYNFAPATAYFSTLANRYSHLSFLSPAQLSRSGSTGTAFDFGAGGAGFPPPYNAGGANFEVRWTGKFTAPTTGLYWFGVSSDDQAIVWIDGIIAANRSAAGGGYVAGPPGQASGSIYLPAASMISLLDSDRVAVVTGLLSTRPFPAEAGPLFPTRSYHAMQGPQLVPSAVSREASLP
jgi:autotransporter-associated beta strand protein